MTTPDHGGAPALEVTDLAIDYRVRRHWRPVVRDVSFQIPAGGSFGLVGESGCGKSTVAMAIVRYLASNGARVERQRAGGRHRRLLVERLERCATCAPGRSASSTRTRPRR